MGLHKTGNLATVFHQDTGRTHISVCHTSPFVPPHLQTTPPSSPCCGFPDHWSSQYSYLQQKLHHNIPVSSLNTSLKLGEQKGPAKFLTGRSHVGPIGQCALCDKNTSHKVRVCLKPQDCCSWQCLPHRKRIFTTPATIHISIALAPVSDCRHFYHSLLHRNFPLSSWI